MKIAVCVIIFLSIAFGVGGTLLISVSFSNNLRQEEQTAVDSYQTVLNMLSVVNSVSPQAYYGSIVDILEQLEDNGGGSWDGLCLTVDGDRIYDSSRVTAYVRDLTDSVEPDQLELMVFAEGGDNYLQVSGSLEAGGTVLYLDSIYDISSIYDFRDTQQRLYRYIFMAIIAVGAIMSFVMAFFMTRPMRELSRTAQEISDGDLSERANVKARDEIGMLAENFNHMADELEKNIEQLQDAMERQEVFMGDFAHEIKTPMTSIIGYSDLLRRQKITGEQAQEAANYIFSEGRRLENLSLKLLDLLVAKNAHPEFSPCSPKKLVAQAASVMGAALEERNITLSQDCDEGICRMEPTLVMSLIINLIDNARKAMDEGGEITVTVRIDGEKCTLTVRDEGCGIPQDKMDKITDAFYRVDKSRSRSMGGVGLGLSLCREIAAVHGGSISFAQAPGRGTQVTVILRGGELS
ncbi:MAG: HAMP domain-containing histidine kinase [Clostridiales bacterium]|nr:HAMP domain-containing histidine kinase [Clostridiales bacterium]